MSSSFSIRIARNIIRVPNICLDQPAMSRQAYILPLFFLKKNNIILTNQKVRLKFNQIYKIINIFNTK